MLHSLRPQAVWPPRPSLGPPSSLPPDEGTCSHGGSLLGDGSPSIVLGLRGEGGGRKGGGEGGREGGRDGGRGGEGGREGRDGRKGGEIYVHVDSLITSTAVLLHVYLQC